MTTVLPYGIILHCSTPSLHNKLASIFLKIQKDSLFPAGLDLLLLPDTDSVKEMQKDHHCLLFFEADPTHLERSKKQLEQWTNRFEKGGHQIILLVSDDYDYFELAKKFEIGNILSQKQFDAPLLSAITHKLLSTHFFGPKPFFPNGFSLFDKKYLLSGNFPGISAVGNYFSDFLNTLQIDEQTKFLGYLAELLTNALSYGVVGISPKERDQLQKQLPTSVTIPEGKEIEIHIVQDEEKYAISISDRSGTLTLNRILEKLRRHTPLAGELLPAGIEDFAGRGLFLLSRENRLVFNILRKKQTEIILMHFLEAKTNRYQPLIINEKMPDEIRNEF